MDVDNTCDLHFIVDRLRPDLLSGFIRTNDIALFNRFSVKMFGPFGLRFMIYFEEVEGGGVGGPSSSPHSELVHSATDSSLTEDLFIPTSTA